MTTLLNWLDTLPWGILIIGSLTLGLAPFVPEPHLVEKLRMLVNGELKAAIDWFDLAMHGAFPLLLIVKLLATVFRQVA